MDLANDPYRNGNVTKLNAKPVCPKVGIVYRPHVNIPFGDSDHPRLEVKGWEYVRGCPNHWEYKGWWYRPAVREYTGSVGQIPVVLYDDIRYEDPPGEPCVILGNNKIIYHYDLTQPPFIVDVKISCDGDIKPGFPPDIRGLKRLFTGNTGATGCLPPDIPVPNLPPDIRDTELEYPDGTYDFGDETKFVNTPGWYRHPADIIGPDTPPGHGWYHVPLDKPKRAYIILLDVSGGGLTNSIAAWHKVLSEYYGRDIKNNFLWITREIYRNIDEWFCPEDYLAIVPFSNATKDISFHKIKEYDWTYLNDPDYTFVPDNSNVSNINYQVYHALLEAFYTRTIHPELTETTEINIILITGNTDSNYTLDPNSVDPGDCSDQALGAYSKTFNIPVHLLLIKDMNYISFNSPYNVYDFDPTSSVANYSLSALRLFADVMESWIMECDPVLGVEDYSAVIYPKYIRTPISDISYAAADFQRCYRGWERTGGIGYPGYWEFTGGTGQLANKTPNKWYYDTTSNTWIYNNPSHTPTPPYKPTSIEERTSLGYKMTGEGDKYKYLLPYSYTEHHSGELSIPECIKSEYLIMPRYVSGHATVVDYNQPKIVIPNKFRFDQNDPLVYVWIINHPWGYNHPQITIYDADNNYVSPSLYRLIYWVDRIEVWFNDGLLHYGHAIVIKTQTPQEMKPEHQFAGSGGTGGTGSITGGTGNTGANSNPGATGFTGRYGCTGGTGGTGNSGGSGWLGQSGYAGAKSLITGDTGGTGGKGPTGGTGCLAHITSTGGTGGTGPTGGTGGVNANPEGNPTGGSGGTGSPGKTGGTGSYTHTTGGTGGTGSVGFTGPIGETGHVGGTGSNLPTRDIIYAQHDVYLRRFKIKVYSPIINKAIINVYSYDDNNNPYPDYLWSVSPDTFKTYFRQKGLPVDIKNKIALLDQTEVILDHNITNKYFVDIYDYANNKTTNYYVSPGVYSYDYRVLLSQDTTSISFNIPGLRSYYVNKQYVVSNINNPLADGPENYKLYYPEWKFNQPYLKLFFKQFDDDAYYDLLSGKALPWCNEYTNYTYVVSYYYDFMWSGQSQTVRFDVSLKSNLFSLGAFHADMTLLIDKDSSPNY